MKKSYQVVLGLLSSLFFALGFTQASERLDPLSHKLQASTPSAPNAPVMPCTIPCDLP
jgi:hypothetical protein